MREFQNLHDMEFAPNPRPANTFTCIVIALYGVGFFIFLLPWLDSNCPNFVIKSVLLCGLAFVIHFLILKFRQNVYDLTCKIAGRRIRFFGFPYFFLICAMYAAVFIILPFATDFIKLPNGIDSILNDRNVTMYILFSGRAVVVNGLISGFDIYPVNSFGTKESIRELIGITRDLMKLCNRALVIVVGSIIIGWAFKKVDFSLKVIYLTTYGVIGFALGGTGVLGSRVTDLLYLLSDLEKDEEVVPRNWTVV